jgi:hypothetical protein
MDTRISGDHNEAYQILRISGYFYYPVCEFPCLLPDKLMF